MATKLARRLATTLALVFLNFAAYADNVMIGPRGVNSEGLKLPNGNDLNGAGIAIGQVEVTRPAKNPPDTIALLACDLCRVRTPNHRASPYRLPFPMLACPSKYGALCDS